MDRATSSKRPWLAAGLAFVLTGLGHVYLRRWARALGWIGAIAMTTWLFVPSSGELTIWAVAPIVFVGTLSVVDAYLLAYYRNARSQIEVGERCPSCHRDLDGELSFCRWCGADASASPGRRHTHEGTGTTEGQ
ncbi:DUF7575 domain-containing protein [Halalkalicoccus tibetensis]|uniref:Zinc ribbon domain-containing protein n=1 Tax=Halalkalicoccus tibetensis TaxID=175632 RepID=A0ABD5V3B5_9EURY